MPPALPATDRYQRTIDASRRVRWEIERDVIRARRFDYMRPFLPDGLSLAGELAFLSPSERRLLSQVQGRSYAAMFGLVERFISAKMLEISREHWLGDQVVLEALVRMTDEELKHQALFRRLESQFEQDMPAGWRLASDANDVARAVLGKGTWAVLALTLHFELFTLAHYRASIEPQPELCELWRDVFLFHWREESQHAIVDELELLREDSYLTDDERESALDEFIELVGTVDALLQAQAAADTGYFLAICPGRFDAVQRERIGELVLKAYRWQYIVSGASEPRFRKTIAGLLSPSQLARLNEALEPLSYAMPLRDAREAANA